jgi:hypothetical protein
VKIYLGIVGDHRVQAFAEKHDCGWCLTPENNRSIPSGSYFLDNGAFTAWKNQKKWNENKFFDLLKKYPDYDFVVVPDIVCGGIKSLELSKRYAVAIPRPRYLAAQDGMLLNDVMFNLDLFDGIFIGGSIPWKFQTASAWSQLAHNHDLKCHAGRVGTWEGMIHMHFCGADSVDSTTASRHQSDYHIQKYYDHLKNQSQLGMIPA